MKRYGRRATSHKHATPCDHFVCRIVSRLCRHQRPRFGFGNGWCRELNLNKEPDPLSCLIEVHDNAAGVQIDICHYSLHVVAHTLPSLLWYLDGQLDLGPGAQAKLILFRHANRTHVGEIVLVVFPGPEALLA